MPVEKAGASSPLMEAALTIGGQPAGQQGNAPQQHSTEEPAAGSYEKFMTVFGRR